MNINILIVIVMTLVFLLMGFIMFHILASKDIFNDHVLVIIIYNNLPIYIAHIYMC